MNAYQFLMMVPDEQVTRARMALTHIMYGDWYEAANQYEKLALELEGENRKTAELYCEQCRNNGKMFLPVYK